MSEAAPETRHLVSKAFSTATLQEALSLVDQQQVKEEQIDADIKVGTLTGVLFGSFGILKIAAEPTESQSVVVQDYFCGILDAWGALIRCETHAGDCLEPVVFRAGV